MTKIVCTVCGIEYHIPTHYCTKRQEDHKNLYCPNGHSQYFPADCAADVLRRDLQRTQAALHEAEAAREKAEGAVARLKRQAKR